MHFCTQWDKLDALRSRFCASNTCSINGCCGGVRLARQEGGSEALNIAASTGLACATCTLGCAACASATASTLIQNELKAQIASIVAALSNTVSDLGNKAQEWGTDMATQLKNGLAAIANDIMTTGKFNKGSYIDFGNCRFTVEPGSNTYSSKTCVYCCNCVNNLNAVQFYLAWRLDCRPGAGRRLQEIDVDGLHS